MVNQARELSPDWMNVKNPLDVGPSGIYGKLLPMFLADPEINMVLAIMVIPWEAVRNFKTVGLEWGIGLGISHLFASNTRISLWSASWSAILSMCMIWLRFVVVPYRFSLHLKRPPGPLLHSGVIPGRERNQGTKDLILAE